ncbi:MAG: hypothetical protein MUC88_02720 [Planctomycetes bacterium]|jgi:hypothetical protein|nr:hypothetical protein [Planctomycetota bacterium]
MTFSIPYQQVPRENRLDLGSERKDEYSRTLRAQLDAREITYTIAVHPDSDPPSGELRFRTPEAERHKTFLPALEGRFPLPEGMDASDLVDDLIDQYGQRCKHHAAQTSPAGEPA